MLLIFSINVVKLNKVWPARKSRWYLKRDRGSILKIHQGKWTLAITLAIQNFEDKISHLVVAMRYSTPRFDGFTILAHQNNVFEEQDLSVEQPKRCHNRIIEVQPLWFLWKTHQPTTKTRKEIRIWQNTFWLVPGTGSQLMVLEVGRSWIDIIPSVIIDTTLSALLGKPNSRRKRNYKKLNLQRGSI